MKLKEGEMDFLRKLVLGLWLLLLLPWLLFAPLSGMVFDAGPSIKANFCVLSVLTYPISVLIAGLLRNQVPWLLALPLVNIGGLLIAGT
jgi:hypothetical protein